jgi:hypothetical protein
MPLLPFSNANVPPELFSQASEIKRGFMALENGGDLFLAEKIWWTLVGDYRTAVLEIAV